MQVSIEEMVEKSQRNPVYSYTLWQQFRPLCMKWVKKLRHTQDSTEDLLQESYVIMVEALKRYNADGKMGFEGYYKTSLYNWGRNYARKKRACLIFEEEEGDFWSNIIDEGAEVEACIIQQEQTKKLKKALHRLSQEDRDLLMRVYVKGESLKEIAKVYALPYKTLASRKLYAVKKLEKFFKEY